MKRLDCSRCGYSGPWTGSHECFRTINVGGNQGRGDPPLARIDMDQVTRAALGERAWRLEFDCNGKPFVWTGDARTEAEADAKARIELARDQEAFRPADARLVAAIPRR